MFYAAGHCTECSKSYVKRSLQPIELTWDQCVMCDKGSVPYVQIRWERYLMLMEDGAMYVQVG